MKDVKSFLANISSSVKTEEHWYQIPVVHFLGKDPDRASISDIQRAFRDARTDHHAAKQVIDSMIATAIVQGNLSMEPLHDKTLIVTKPSFIMMDGLDIDDAITYWKARITGPAEYVKKLFQHL